ncbi:zinc-ribbon domain-containing protein [Pedobacter caeni]|uniref:Uncharacterized protein n=1 Tax=Pedobacter caeni TaxID=288992 RepID=A0A1M5JSF0_9SPHI|nr:zinc-ribbon domain-containing protein [Pedobacter caeni]SHG43345.1 hypothetical protein SAMN04488522_105489 [Pedobacter caeni]
MIIFGARTKFLTASVSGQTCGHCDTGKLNLVYTIRYFHIFWIPMFPLEKRAMTQCPHCKQVLTSNELAPESRNYLNTQKSAIRTPLKYFAGLIIIGLFILFIVVATAFNKTGRYVNKPKVGDIYQIKSDTENQFTFLKIVKIEGDSLILAVHKLNHVPQADINEQRVFEHYDKDFTPLTFKMSRNNIKSMTKGSKNLVEVFRK